MHIASKSRVIGAAGWHRLSGALSSFSLGAKLSLAAGSCAVASLAVTGVAIGWYSSGVAAESAMDSARSTAKIAALEVQSQLSATFMGIQSLSHVLEVTRKAGPIGRREWVDEILQTTLTRNPQWLGLSSGWEPQALDGRDLEFAGKGGANDSSGRYVSYWNRASGEVAVEPLVDYEKAGANDWYDVPRRTGKSALIEPYTYEIAGKGVLMTTLAAPIRVDGKFVGVVCVDYLLSNLQKALAGVQSLPGSKVVLISTGGMYVSHPDADRIGKPAADLSAQALAAVRGGQPFQYVDAAGQVRVLSPVNAAAGTSPWSLGVEFSQSVAQAPARDLMRLTALIAAGCALMALLVMSLVVHALMRPVRRLAVTMESLAGGHSNLGVELPVRGRDELARIAQAFNGFMTKLRSTFAEVRDTSGKVNASAAEISSGNLDLSGRTEKTAANLTEIADAMGGLANGVRASAETARVAEELTREAGKAGERSEAVMKDAVDAMEGVSQSSRRISEITAVIDSIAFQTNILALNAAVEAARAGEQGRGFAVVASEVRSLAQRSAEAAKDIKGLIGDSASRVERGTGLIRQTGAAVDHLVFTVGKVSSLVASINETSQQQASGIAKVESAISLLDDMTQQNAAMVEQSAAAASGLSDQTRRLSATLLAFA
ncbi:MAG: trg3 [Rhizobacter sp.]|nr:trg3 [Rhizobacter sp.]